MVGSNFGPAAGPNHASPLSFLPLCTRCRPFAVALTWRSSRTLFLLGLHRSLLTCKMQCGLSSIPHGPAGECFASHRIPQRGSSLPGGSRATAHSVVRRLGTSTAVSSHRKLMKPLRSCNAKHTNHAPTLRALPFLPWASSNTFPHLQSLAVPFGPILTAVCTLSTTAVDSRRPVPVTTSFIFVELPSS